MKFINSWVFKIVISDFLLNYYIYSFCFVDIINIDI